MSSFQVRSGGSSLRVARTGGSRVGCASSSGNGVDRHALEQQRFDGADAHIAMEAPLHHVAMQNVVEREQAHALVVRHIGVNDHAALAVALFSRLKSMDS